MSGPNCPNYEMIKVMAQVLGRPAHSLLALSDSRDPFYVTPGRLALAQWFAGIWDVLNPPHGYHLRRLHYRLVVMPDAERPKKLNGAVYLNIEEDWKTLSGASVDARALGLVDAAKFTDRRAGEPVYIADDSGEGADASIFCYGAELDSPPEETAFAFEYEPERFEFPDLPNALVNAPRLAEPYAIEVWAEKSTMNDILVPLAQRLNVTLVTGLGELSFTHCLWHIRRVLAHRKKMRILYIPVEPHASAAFTMAFGGVAWTRLAWALAIAIVLQFVLNRTRFGLHTIATGGNLVAASEVGIKVTTVKICNFVLCSILGGFAGVIDAFRIGSIDPLAGGSEIMFMAIASAVIGGTLLTGGSGTVIGALIGALALGILQDGFTLSGVSAFTFDMILGAAILVTMAVNVRLTMWRERGSG